MLQNVAISALRVRQGGPAPPQCLLYSSPSEQRQSPYQPSSVEAGLLIHNQYYYTAANTSLSRSSSLSCARAHTKTRVERHAVARLRMHSTLA